MNSTFHRHVRPNGDKQRTITGIYNETSNILNIGVAVCNPKDHYNKKLGRKISTGRAEKHPDASITVETKEDALKTFHNYCNEFGGKKVNLKLK